jgi:hypothetical protein
LEVEVARLAGKASVGDDLGVSCTIADDCMTDTDILGEIIAIDTDKTSVRVDLIG